jgi:serine/threonine-protein kinase
MQPALGSARREQAQRPTQAAGFYSQLGRCRRATGERQSARLLFERALALRRAGGAKVAAIESRLDLADLYADAGETVNALAGFEAARVQLKRDAGDRHPLLIEIGRKLAILHRAQGRPGAAERELRGALALALESSGAAHPTTLEIRGELASLLIDLGRYGRAEQELRARHGGLVARLGVGDAGLRDSHSALGRIAWQRGNTAAALTALRVALASSRRAGDPVQVSDSQLDLAEVLLGSGRAGEALPLLEQAAQEQSRARAQGRGPARIGDGERLLGEAYDALGRPDDARRHFDAAVRLTRESYALGHPQSRLAELALARHEARAGNIAALARLDALAALAERDPELRAVAWRARAAAAQVRCAGPGRDAAQSSLDAMLATLRSTRPDGSALTREVAAIRAGCL